MPTPDWLTVGAQVAEYTCGNIPRVNRVTVERLTATQVILAGGKRYQLRTLRPVGETRRSAWSPFTELRPLTDSSVRDTLAEQTLRNLFHKVDTLTRETARGAAGVLATIEAVEKATAAARAAVENLTEEGSP